MVHRKTGSVVATQPYLRPSADSPVPRKGVYQPGHLSLSGLGNTCGQTDFPGDGSPSPGASSQGWDSQVRELGREGGQGGGCVHLTLTWPLPHGGLWTAQEGPRFQTPFPDPVTFPGPGIRHPAHGCLSLGLSLGRPPREGCSQKPIPG